MAVAAEPTPGTTPPPSPRVSIGKVLIFVGIACVTGVVGIGIVAVLVVPMVLQKFAAASTGKAKADITQLDSAIEEYHLANGGRYPDSLEELVSPDVNGHTYVKAKQIPKDPWGNDYLYEPSRGRGVPPVVRSLGRDGLPGGEGDDADLDSVSIRTQR
jgi:general secretion pathway protein G